MISRRTRTAVTLSSCHWIAISDSNGPVNIYRINDIYCGLIWLIWLWRFNYLSPIGVNPKQNTTKRKLPKCTTYGTWKKNTLSVRKRKYLLPDEKHDNSGIWKLYVCIVLLTYAAFITKMSTLWLPMPWLRASPCHRQPFYWQSRLNTHNDVFRYFEYMCHISVTKSETTLVEHTYVKQGWYVDQGSPYVNLSMSSRVRLYQGNLAVMVSVKP